MPFNNNEYGPGPVPPVAGQQNVSLNNLTAAGSVTAGGVVTNGLATNSGAVATPGVPAASTDLTSVLLVDAIVYFLTAGTAVSVTTTNGSGTTIVSGIPVVAGSAIGVPAGWKINLGAYTVAPTWTWAPL